MSGALVVLKSFALLAAVAFVAGFLGYLAVIQPGRAWAQPSASPQGVSFPASADWNLPKHI
jgi:hypothetical protein